MARLRIVTPNRSDAHRIRSGVSRAGVVISLLVISALPAAAWLFWPAGFGNVASNQAIFHTVNRATFRHVITESGEIESSSNVEVRCEVQSRSAGAGAGTIILKIVPEGSWVEKDDLIARLDSSALEDERVLQEITVNSAYSLVVQAESAVRTAEIAKLEYVERTFREEQQLILAEMSVAEEGLRRARDYLRYSENLFARGFQNELQLDADRFAVEKAETDLETAQIKLEGLRKYTREKMLSDLNANIKVAKTDLESKNATHEAELSRLNFIGDQIAKCEILAPAAGQVVYANEYDRRGGEEMIIEAGTPVREGQAIVRLPDPSQMQVKASIDEARIDRVHTGMAATIKLDAMPDLELNGTVIKVDDYPIPGSSWNNVKQYAATVAIKDSPAEMRPGLTAEVRIHVQRQVDVLQVPVQAVFEHQRRHYCVVPTNSRGEEFAARQVAIGWTNDKFVVIDKGLDDGERVVLNPRSFREAVGLPDVSASDRPAQGNVTADEIQPAMLKQLDMDRDGKLSREEVPTSMRASFDRNDSNGDGFLDVSEMASDSNRRSHQRDADGRTTQEAPRRNSDSSESADSGVGGGQ